jgi:hypothetical protein
MKLKLALVFTLIQFFTTALFAQRVRYSGRHHSYSHGGYYAGGHSSSHRGGHYRNTRTHNHYGRHKRKINTSKVQKGNQSTQITLCLSS